jgi:hypothetical protein
VLESGTTSNRVNNGGSSRSEVSRITVRSVIVYMFTLTSPVSIIAVLYMTVLCFSSS